MADKPEKKSFATRLRDIFKRSSQPPVPNDIVNNKQVQKAVFKQHRRKRWRALRNVALVSTALSTILHFNPDIVSTSYDDHMAARGYPYAHAKNFHAANVRVLDRSNPLLPFYTAGTSVTEGWREADRQNMGMLTKIVITPIVYTAGFAQGVGDIFSGNALDAHSLSTNAPLDQRNVYIRPPADDFTVNDFLREFAGLHLSNLQFRNDNEAIARILYEYVMLHEARHGDQSKSVSTALNEADADRYAFAVLETRGYKPELLQEVREIVTHGRTMASVLGGGTSHATSLSLMRQYPTAFDAYEDGATFKRLHDILADAVHMNEDRFDENMPHGNRMIYVSAALFVQGTLNNNRELREANNHFRMATLFFQQASGYALFGPMENFHNINVDYLKRPYTAAPDKTVPAAKTQPPAKRPLAPASPPTS